MSTSDVAAEVRRTGLVAKISDSTVWRWLSFDAIKPWQHRCWIFPRDPFFAAKASRILDLYERVFDGEPLKDDEFVLSTDEKTSIQARARRHPSLAPNPGKRCESSTNTAGAAHGRTRGPRRLSGQALRSVREKDRDRSFHRLVDQVMTQPPYNDARRVFWIMDNGSSHRGAACVKRLVDQYPRIVPVHGPIHASWLNQIEIYFSIVQRKVLTPNDFLSLAAVSGRLFAFERHYEAIAKPFEWKFTRHDLTRLLAKMETVSTGSQAAA
jgi:hypothetical protein